MSVNTDDGPSICIGPGPQPWWWTRPRRRFEHGALPRSSARERRGWGDDRANGRPRKRGRHRSADPFSGPEKLPPQRFSVYCLSPIGVQDQPDASSDGSRRLPRSRPYRRAGLPAIPPVGGPTTRDLAWTIALRYCSATHRNQLCTPGAASRGRRDRLSVQPGRRREPSRNDGEQRDPPGDRQDVSVRARRHGDREPLPWPGSAAPQPIGRPIHFVSIASPGRPRTDWPEWNSISDVADSCRAIQGRRPGSRLLRYISYRKPLNSLKIHTSYKA
jgi:hypothetical protein